MSVLPLLSTLKKSGINVELVDEKLKLNAPQGKLTPALLNELKDKKEEIILFLKRNIRAQFQYVSIEPVEEKDYYALSSAQKRLYFHQQIDLKSTAYNIPGVVELSGSTDKERITETFKKLIRRHESLRTSFEVVDGEPVQRVHKHVEFNIECYDSVVAGPGITSIVNDFTRPFNLRQAPLLRVGLLETGDEISFLMVDVHHIISDGVAHQILVQDFFPLSQDEKLPPLRLQYKDFSEWQNRLFETGAFRKQEVYWLKEFEGEPPLLHLPYDYPRPAIKSTEGGRVEVEVSARDTEALRKMALDEEVTLFILLLTIYNIFLQKISGQEDIVVGAATANRRHPDLEQIIGFFVNILAFRNYPSGHKTFLRFLKEVKERTVSAFENQEYQFEDLVDKVLVNRDAGRHPLLDVGFSFSPGGAGVDSKKAPEPGNTGKSGEARIESHTSKLDLSLFITEGPGNFILTFAYSTALFRKDTIERFANYFKQTVSSILKNPGQKTADIDILPGGERRRILFDFNDNKAAFSRDGSIYRFIEKHAELTPERIALGFAGSQLTYREINERADRLAVVLRNRGIREDRLVGILLERSPLMLESILAVWKAGGAYIPIDSLYPVQRIRGIMEDSGAAVLLTRSERVVPELAENINHLIVDLDGITMGGGVNRTPSNLDPEAGGNMDALAYVIYTSGSTGKPKGVMVEHIGMMNHIQAKIDDLKLTAESIVAQNASHTFDISVWQLFAALVPGGKTVIYPDELILEPRKFVNRLIHDSVTILEVVPSYLSILIDSVFRDRDVPLLLPVKYLLVTGEEIKANLVKKWFEIYPGIKMVNAYGPTEASDDITHYIMDEAPGVDRIPIGKPVQNLNIYIVDEHMNLCPIGVKGEICVSGVGVGRGYLFDEEKTAQVFMTDPFSRVKGVRLYKTGDLGRWLPHGNIEFFGRKDYQVKIRGFRIELGEIENKMVSFPAVKEAVVLDREDENGNKYLCAYLVPVENLNTSELKEYLARHLPAYMVPAHFVELAKLPLTPNGKIHRKALPAPGIGNTSGIPRLTEKMLNEIISSGPKSLVTLSGAEKKKFLDTLAASSGKEKQAVEHHSLQIRETCYPLSHSQKMIYYIEKRNMGTGCNNIAFTVKYPEALDPERLEKAINKTLAGNEGLRLRIIEIDREGFIVPAQYAADYKESKPDYIDFPGEEGEKRLEEWLEQKTKEPFDFIDSDLFYFAYVRFNEKEAGYYMKIHHCIFDGVSAHIVFREIDRNYRGPGEGKISRNKSNPSYLRYISDEQRYLESSRVPGDMEFWLNYLLPLPQEISLSTVSANRRFLNSEAETAKLVFPGDLRRKIHEYCKENKTSLFKVILSALAIYTSKVTLADDFVIGTLNNNRSDLRYVRTVGPFINFTPIRIKIGADMDFYRFEKETGGVIDNIIRNRRQYPFELLVDQIRETIGADLRFLHNISLISYPDLEGKRFMPERRFSGHEATPLSIYINRSNRDILGVLELEWVYRLEQFTGADIERMQRGLVSILGDVLCHPGKGLSSIGVPGHETVGGRGPYRHVWIGGTRIYPRRIENLLAGHADIDRAAVVAVPGKRGNKSLCVYITTGKNLTEAGLREYLRKELPETMVPPVFVRLEKMPLHPDGEINRELLETLDVRDHSEPGYNAPRYEVEEKLAKIWSELLGIEIRKIGIENSFFELGGNSLGIIMMVSKINKEFGVEVPIPQIYQTPVIKEISRMIESRNFADDDVVLLNPSKQKGRKAVFCFPPQMAYGLEYFSLASLVSDYSFYAFSFIEEEDRLRQYVDLVLKHQPVGPYLFFGYSSAGPLTFQAARAMEDRGYEVSDIIFFDCFYTDRDPVEDVVNTLDENVLAGFHEYLEEVLEGLGVAFLKEKLIEKTGKYMEYNFSITGLETIHANVHVVVSEQFRDTEYYASWKKFTTGSVHVYQGDGENHQLMFSPGYVEKNAEVFLKVLERIGPGNLPKR